MVLSGAGIFKLD